MGIGRFAAAVRPYRLPDHFQHHASREDLLAEAGLDMAGIRAAVLARWPKLDVPTPAAASR